jgi:hypothetical protein
MDSILLDLTAVTENFSSQNEARLIRPVCTSSIGRVDTGAPSFPAGLSPECGDIHQREIFDGGTVCLEGMVKRFDPCPD